MIVRARMVVTMDGPPIENGAVAISGNRIIDLGSFDEVKGRNSGEIVDLGEQALLPAISITPVCAARSRRKNLLPIGFAQSMRRRRSSPEPIIFHRSRKVLRKQKDSERRQSRT